MKNIFIYTTFLLSTFAFQVNALNEELLIEQIDELDWQIEAGKYRLNGTDTSVTISHEEILARGADAHKYSEITEGHNKNRPDAVVVRQENNDLFSDVYYEFIESGFLEMDDWDESIDKDEMMEIVKKDTEKLNKARKDDYPSIYVDGWSQEPYLDREQAVVYWAISLHADDGQPLVNAVALKLGRKGFGRVVWVGDPVLFTDAEYVLRRSLNTYEFDDGARYSDFVPGVDTIAAVGIGALVYKMITGKKATKTVGLGLLALLAVFAKKLWFLIFIPFIFLFGWVRNLFGRKARKTEQ